MAGPLGVTHLLMLSKTEMGTYLVCQIMNLLSELLISHLCVWIVKLYLYMYSACMYVTLLYVLFSFFSLQRFCRIPRGPTLTFKIQEVPVQIA